MSQYPKWFLALTLPNVIIAALTMIFFMFGGLHPFGDVTNIFWSFILYLLGQIFWIAPIILFFVSIFSWGWMREKTAIATAIAGWGINAAALYIILS